MKVASNAFVILNKVQVFPITVEPLFTFILEMLGSLIFVRIHWAFAIFLFVVKCVVVINLVKFLFKAVFTKELSVVLLRFLFFFSFLVSFLRFVLSFQSIVPMLLQLRVQIECLSHIG